jgi:hypothetical protein
MNPSRRLRRSQRVNFTRSFEDNDRVTRLSKSPTSLPVIRIFSTTLSLQGLLPLRGVINGRWGSMSYLELTDDDIQSAKSEIQAPTSQLGVFVLFPLRTGD